jgi:hypothetical protein
MKIKLESFKQSVKKIFYYLLFITSFVLTYYIGYYSNMLKYYRDSKPYTTVYKKNVNLAQDERGNLLIIDKETGNYILYEDSVGKSIFFMYTKKIAETP